MQKNKIFSYLGFAKKSGQIVFGVDNIKICKKKIYLVLVSYDLSDNSLNTLLNLQKTKKFKMIQSVDDLNELLVTKNCKAIGVLNKELSEAIFKEEKHIKIMNDEG